MVEKKNTQASGLSSQARYWRERAQHARAMTKLLGLGDARRRMDSIADDYDRLAEQAEQREKERK